LLTSLTSRVAVVTGGGEGIGRAISHALAAAGARVAVADIDAAAAERVARELTDAGARVLAARVDVADAAAVEALAERVERELGPVSVLCNNAGVLLEGPLVESPLEDWQWVLSVNVMGVVHGVRAFAPRMRAHGQGGHIVNTASMAGLAPRLEGRAGIYAASKAAVVGYTELLRAELARDGIGVSALCPSTVATRIWEASRNRPASLGPGRNVPRPPRATDALDPNAVGPLVVHGILEDRAYIYTGDDAEPRLQDRFERLLRDARAQA